MRNIFQEKTFAQEKLFSYIQSKNWGNFDNKGMHLLIRSIQLHGFRQFQKNAPRKMFLEDILLHCNDRKQLKMFSLKPFFSKETKRHYMKNPKLILGYIKKSNIALGKAGLIILQAQEDMARTDCEKLTEKTKQLLEVFFEISYWKYYITAISNELYSENSSNKNINSVFKKICAWKNNLKYYNFEGDALIEISHFLALQRKLKIQGQEIVRYFHLREFLDFLDKKITRQEIIDLISKRKNFGYISLNLAHPDYENALLCNLTPEAKKIKKYLNSVFSITTKKETNQTSIRGISIIKTKSLVRGKCVMVNNFNELKKKSNLKNKILVTTLSTPEFLPYIENIKAIVTDTGGTLSHTAIIAREFNIPCIVGTNIATTFLKTDDEIEMNMETGIIRKII